MARLTGGVSVGAGSAQKGAAAWRLWPLTPSHPTSPQLLLPDFNWPWQGTAYAPGCQARQVAVLVEPVLSLLAPETRCCHCRHERGRGGRGAECCGSGLRGGVAAR